MPRPRDLAAFLEGSAGRTHLIAADDYPRGPLEHNTFRDLEGIETGPIGDVLLTGATGFLGAHILRELLGQEDRRVVCLVRPGGGMT